MEIANRTQDLHIQLLEAQGMSEEALAARRALALAGLDNDEQRQLQKDIWKLTDAAEALQKAAEEAKAAAEAAAALRQDQRSLNIQIWSALADQSPNQAVKNMYSQMIKQQERADILAKYNTSDPAQRVMRDMYENLWRIQDATEAAAAALELFNKKRDLEITLLESMGLKEEALAMRRRAELAAMDESLQATQLQIWAAQDLTASIDKFQARARQIADWMDSTNRSDLSPVKSAAAWDAEYQKRRTGAFGSGASDQQISEYLSYATEYLSWQKSYGTEGSYQAIYDAIMGDMASLATATDSALSIAEQQLAVLQGQVSATIAEGDRQAALMERLIGAVLTGQDMPAHASGGLTRGRTITGEIGPEWNVPTYEPQRSSFLRTVGADPATLGKAIAQYIQSSDGGSGGEVTVHSHVYLDGKEIQNSVSKGFRTNGDLIQSVRKAVQN
jgi:hypothetical protein